MPLGLAPRLLLVAGALGGTARRGGPWRLWAAAAGGPAGGREGAGRAQRRGGVGGAQGPGPGHKRSRSFGSCCSCGLRPVPRPPRPHPRPCARPGWLGIACRPVRRVCPGRQGTNRTQGPADRAGLSQENPGGGRPGTVSVTSPRTRAPLGVPTVPVRGPRGFRPLAGQMGADSPATTSAPPSGRRGGRGEAPTRCPASPRKGQRPLRCSAGTRCLATMGYLSHSLSPCESRSLSKRPTRPAPSLSQDLRLSWGKEFSYLFCPEEDPAPRPALWVLPSLPAPTPSRPIPAHLPRWISPPLF